MLVKREHSLGLRVLGCNVLVVGRGYNIWEPSTSKPKFPTNLPQGLGFNPSTSLIKGTIFKESKLGKLVVKD